ncbi:MAG: alpha-amylase, partial [Cytophagaceae bacterium]
MLSATAAVNTTPAYCFGSCAACSGVPSTNYATYWWNDAVFYEVFVRSFYDSNGDGKGDFAGLTSKLDYLNDGNAATTTDLGVTALWLMPTMASPSYHGYDISDYKATQPDYGTMAEFETFLAAAHQRGIKVILDLVLNHSSNQHPWFTQSASSTTSPY